MSLGNLIKSVDPALYKEYSLDRCKSGETDQVAQYPVAVLSAGWYWDTRKLNQWADKDDVATVTKKINGGAIGLADRTQHFHHIKEVLELIHEEENS